MDFNIENYSLHTISDIRFCDTDAQGHVNNTVFAVFLEAGKAEFMYSTQRKLVDAGAQFVQARMEIDYKAELSWPGRVRIGSRIKYVGRSSLQFEQIIYQEQSLAAHALSTIVQVNSQTRKPMPMSEELRARLLPYMRLAES